MLSPSTVAIVKSTLPILAGSGVELTDHFYRRMFAGNPEVRSLFNPAHQHAGSQQRALAGAILAYAEHIERPEALGAALELIAQKHAALGVEPHHYPIVGEHLLGSMKELLGDLATDEVLGAWAEAYGFLAGVLIERERAIYAEREQRHGWRGFRPFIVARKQPESEAITSFYLEPLQGGLRSDFLPGQYVTVRVPGPHGDTTMRTYSLSDRPGKPYYRISVKRETAATPGTPAGHVSNLLHDAIAVGDRIELGAPCGEFVLDRTARSDRPLALLSGGVGVTPLLSMLHAAVDEGLERDICFIHCALNGRTHAFAEEVRDAARRHPRLRVHIRYSAPEAEDRTAGRCDSEGFLDQDLLDAMLPGPDADYYFCGPRPFMAGVLRMLRERSVPANRIRFEFFGPMGDLEQAPGVARQAPTVGGMASAEPSVESVDSRPSSESHTFTHPS
jgi:nitric oxide dioxygenase